MLPRNGTGAVIISPTRELAMQIFGVLREIMEEYPGQTCGLVSWQLYISNIGIEMRWGIYWR
jgi:superfamily II DNA/RNA helicase